MLIAQNTAFDDWRTHVALSLAHAAALIAGVPPRQFQPGEGGFVRVVIENDRYEENEDWEMDIARSQTMLNSLVIAVEYGKIPSKNIPATIEGVHPFSTTVLVTDLKKWLHQKEMHPWFFFPSPRKIEDFLDKQHPRYAPKLAAAVMAWRAVDAPVKKSAKAALIAWLTQHADVCGLKRADGKLNKQGIDQIAAVANWQIEGGAPKTSAI